LVAFTDGSCYQNGWRTGVGAYATLFPHATSCNIASPLPGVGTSIRAELQAAIQACAIADEIDPSHEKMLVIYTDSKFLIKVVTDWVWGWAHNGWIKADGQAVANPDLILQLYEHALARDMTLIWVRAHTSKRGWQFYWNKKADRLARQACDQEKAARGVKKHR
jgi:ribonuclease HI